MKTFEGPLQLRWRRKRTEEGKINKRVLGSEVARYVVWRQLTSYLHPNTASAPSNQGNV